MSTSARITPVEPGTRPELAPLEKNILEARGRISLLYKVLLNSPPVCDGWEQMMTAIRNKTSLAPRLRELIILRIAVLNKAAYEFDAHVPHAEKAGVTAEQIAAVRETPVGAAIPADERLALELTDVMTRDIQVPDALFDKVRARYDDRSRVELAATIASYNMVSRFLVALHIE
jgi:AhpD family alkylhydroperoxidase